VQSIRLGLAVTEVGLHVFRNAEKDRKEKKNFPIMYLILYVYIKEYTSPQTMIFKTLLIMSG
jgi:hypothetical protein